MPLPIFLNFDLLFERAASGYRVRVVQSPAGEASAEFAPPFAQAELAAFFARVGRGSGAAADAVSDAEAVKQFGARLFDAAFRERVRETFRRALDEATRQGAGLRVRLRLNDVPELADLPWEYLYDSARNRFLALSTETPLVRYLELAALLKPFRITPPLHILVMISNPRDYPELDAAGEWLKMQAAFQELIASGMVKLERMETTTVEELQRRLRRADIHIFHFIGHGAFVGEKQEGVVIFTDAAGRGRGVSGEKLGAVLSSEQSLRLVVLNACEGARTATGNPFAGVAPRLVEQGIPAALAMQFAITDAAALAFSHEFYRALADLFPVDAAVTEARRAVYFNQETLEWGTPVLFMRAPDGMLFESEEGGDGRRLRRVGDPSVHGGVSISGEARVSVRGDIVGGDKIVGSEQHAAGDMNIVTIGAGAQVGKVAAGKNIIQDGDVVTPAPGSATRESSPPLPRSSLFSGFFDWLKRLIRE